MRIIFMGSPDFAVPTLDALVEAGHELAAVYTQPPRPAGRGKGERPTPVAVRAQDLGIEVHSPKSLRRDDDHVEFEALDADVAVVAAYPGLQQIIAAAERRSIPLLELDDHRSVAGSIASSQYRVQP